MVANQEEIIRVLRKIADKGESKEMPEIKETNIKMLIHSILSNNKLVLNVVICHFLAFLKMNNVSYERKR